LKNWRRLARRFYPAIPRNWLLALAGVMWTGVGVLLCDYAVTWLEQAPLLIALALGVLGIGISIAANRYQFSALAVKNIERILAYPERACAFAFQAWRGYLIIGVMVTTGIVLRHSAVPKPYLAVIYAAVGGALLQASVNYYTRLAQVWVQG
jgi:hypothetical protein